MPSKNRTETTAKTETETASETAASKLRSALITAPGSTATDLAASIGINKSTAGKILARWEANGTAVRAARGVVEGRRAGDLWTAADVAGPEVVAAPAVVEVAAPADELFGPPPVGRLRPGALRHLVEDFLQQHPSEAFGPTHIGRVLGRSQGAVNNALEASASAGTLVKTQAAPKRFAIAPGSK